MTKRFFGTDGIRGKVGTSPITPEFAIKLGWAAGRVLSGSGINKVIIGKDTRISGYMIESALQSGLSAAGMDAHLTGPLPTPAIAYLTKTFRADVGIVISASHNPYDDNGIKFFAGNGEKLSDKLESRIEEEIESPLICVPSDKLGKAYRLEDATGRYIEFCKAAFPSRLSLTGLDIVLDCAHGAAYRIAPLVFSELGANVHTIGDRPNGININDQCGATSLELLHETVSARKAHLGIALDGDGDRVMMVDDQGDIIDGDRLLYILAKYEHLRGQFVGGVAGTLMSNMGLEIALKELGIPFQRSKVGDRYVMELLRINDWLLGGETSGHIICRDVVTTGDGIVTALKVLRVVQETGRSLRELAGEMPYMPQKMINVPLNGGGNPLDTIEVANIIAEAEDALGVASNDPRGRVLLRESGTEPLVRIMVESVDESMATKWATQIAEVVSSANNLD